MKIKDERLKNKTIISLETMAVYYKGERKTDLTAAYEYWELIDSKYVRLYVLVCRNGFVIQSYETEGDVYVVPTIFKNKEAKRRFQY